MKVTADVINDLLPLYSSGECSDDTKKLVDEFLKSNPGAVPQAGSAQAQLPAMAPGALSATDEIRTLAATRRRLRIRSSVMALAIFFSIAPFSFAYTHGTFYTLMAESPLAAIVYGALGLICWGAYFLMKRSSGNI